MRLRKALYFAPLSILKGSIFAEVPLYAIFDQVIKEILTEGGKKFQQNTGWVEVFFLHPTFHNLHDLIVMNTKSSI